MKIIKLFENFKKSLVDQKCDLLNELTLELKDMGLEIIVSKRPVNIEGYYFGNDKCISLVIKDNNKILEYDVLKNDVIKDFILDLKEFGMNPRQIGGGEKFCYMVFDKWGKMTNSEVLKRNESFLNEGGVARQAWSLTFDMKSKISAEINNVLIELVDNGFEIEINHFAKKIAEQNSILVSVHKRNRSRFNTDEIKDNIEVLLDYMSENYDVKGHNYDVEIIGPNNRAVSEEYPDNLEVIEIDIDITVVI